MDAQVKKNKKSQFSIEVSREKGLVTAILKEGMEIKLKKVVATEFDKQYSVYTYSAGQLAERWLTNNLKGCFGTISNRTTEKELIMIAILNADLSNVIGKVADDAMALAGTLAGENGVIVQDAADLAASMKESALITLYNSIVPEDKKITGRVKGGKQVFSNELWAAIEAYELKPVAQAPKAGTGPVARAHSIFAANPGKTRKELIALCVADGINQATATTQYGAFHKGALTMSGTIERNGSVAKVRAIIAAGYAAKKSRKDIIAECEAAGLNKATASTQYGKYAKEEKSKVPTAEGTVEGAATEGAEVAGAAEGTEAAAQEQVEAAAETTEGTEA